MSTVTPRALLQLADCGNCPLNGKSQPTFGSGHHDADLVIIGTAPTRADEKGGKPFTGPTGVILDATLNDVGIDPVTTFRTNLVLCRSMDSMGQDTPPSQKAITCCSNRLKAEVLSKDPKVIVPAGGPATEHLTGEKVGSVQGAMFRWNDHWVIPTYSPGAILQKGGSGFYDDIWNTFNRVGMLASGELEFPPVGGWPLNYRFYGHRGEKVMRDKFYTWSGHWEATKDEVMRGRSAVLRILELADQGPLELSVDTEGRSTSRFEPMTMIQVGNDRWQYAWTWGVIKESLPEFKRMLEHPDITWDLWNTAHDRKVLKHWVGADLEERDRDGMAYALGLTEKGEQTGLKYQSRLWLNAPFYEKELDEYLPTRNSPFDQVPPDVLAKYGCYDVANTYRLVNKLTGILPKLVAKEGTQELVEGLLHSAQRTFAEWEYDGVYIDKEYAEGLEAEWLPIIEEAITKVQDYAQSIGYPKDPKVTGAQTVGIPCPTCLSGVVHLYGDVFQLYPRTEWRRELHARGFGDHGCRGCMKRRFVLAPDNLINVRSSKQLQHLCFDMLKMPQGPDGRSCNEAFWEKNASHQLTKLVMAYREDDHLLRNYIRGISDDIGPDGMIHPDFLLFGTVTGRLAIHNPPLQTLPKWGVNPKKSKIIRKLFAADPRSLEHDSKFCVLCLSAEPEHLEYLAGSDYLVVDVDYSNLELFVAWHYSGDELLAKALTQPGPDGKPDYHRYAAAAMFNTAFENVTGDQRFNSKFVTFGVAYGRQAYSLAQGELKELTGGSERLAQGYIDRFWMGFPKWKEFYDGCQRTALATGELTTTNGRKRRWKLIMPSLENHIRNQAVNFPLQSLASDTCLSAGIRLTKLLKELGWGRVLFTVHDSLVFMIKKAHIHEAVALIKAEMVKTDYETCARFAVDVEVGPSLGEVDQYDKDRVYA